MVAYHGQRGGYAVRGGAACCGACLRRGICPAAPAVRMVVLSIGTSAALHSYLAGRWSLTKRLDYSFGGLSGNLRDPPAIRCRRRAEAFQRRIFSEEHPSCSSPKRARSRTTHRPRCSRAAVACSTIAQASYRARLLHRRAGVDVADAAAAEMLSRVRLTSRATPTCRRASRIIRAVRIFTPVRCRSSRTSSSSSVGRLGQERQGVRSTTADYPEYCNIARRV